MTHIVLLSAGQGKRLSPLTDNKPKCLIPIAGKTLLEWQLLAIEAYYLETGKIEGVTIVTGFEAHSVEAAVNLTSVSVPVTCIYNPFYCVADNIGSCWAARHLLEEGCVLINGDTLFDRQILSKLLDAPENKNNDITVTIDHKAAYDSDDMKVTLENNRLTSIGKTLTGKIDGESIGMLRFEKPGGTAFVNEMESLLKDPSSLRLWYLSIIDRLAKKGPEKVTVGVMSIGDLPWQEVDFPHDLTSASESVMKFNWDYKNKKPGSPAFMESCQ